MVDPRTARLDPRTARRGRPVCRCSCGAASTNVLQSGRVAGGRSLEMISVERRTASDGRQSDSNRVGGTALLVKGMAEA